MRMRVIHETAYCYTEPVYKVAMEARLQPCNDDFQVCHRYRLAINPRTPIYQYTTFSDVAVYHWTVLKTDEIHIVSETMLDIYERPLTTVEAPPLTPDPLLFFPYLEQTPLTALTPVIYGLAEVFAKLAQEDWYQTVLALCAYIHDSMQFELGPTNVTTTATDFLRIGKGVCQDYTHLMLAVLRCLGIPARYVSGYLCKMSKPSRAASQVQRQSQNGQMQSQEQSQSFEPDVEFVGDFASSGIGSGCNDSSFGDKPKAESQGASHAWCEVYLGPYAGWRGFDAVNKLQIDEHFVRIGAGRDYHDITPVKGVHKGRAKESLRVRVQVEALDS